LSARAERRLLQPSPRSGHERRTSRSFCTSSGRQNGSEAPNDDESILDGAQDSTGGVTRVAVQVKLYAAPAMLAVPVPDISVSPASPSKSKVTGISGEI